VAIQKKKSRLNLFHEFGLLEVLRQSSPLLRKLGARGGGIAIAQSIVA
jgi:hypothetical protein